MVLLRKNECTAFRARACATQRCELVALVVMSVLFATLTREKFAGLCIGMSFLWESLGKRGMGWDSTRLYFP